MLGWTKGGAKMIDEKKLIETLEKRKRKATAFSDIDWNSALKVCIDIVKEQPKVGEWIPVSERSPEEEGTYLVAWLPAYKDEKGETFALPCQYPHFYMLADYYEDEEEWNFNLPSGYDEAILLAWMSLPEPYKGE